MSARINWEDFWAMFPGLEEANPEALKNIAKALNHSGDFVEWLATRSPRTRREILAGAPLWIAAALDGDEQRKPG